MSTDHNNLNAVVEEAGAGPGLRPTPGDEPEEKSTAAPIAHGTISNTEAAVPHVVDGWPAFNPPDRGWRAWSQVVAALCINCMVWGLPTAFGVFQLHYVEAMGIPAAQASWIGSIQLFITFALCALSGRLADAGFVRQAVGCGSALILLGTFATSLSREYWHLVLAQGVCTGVGTGVSFMPAVSVVSSYFKDNRAFALAVSATGTSVGSVVFPTAVQYLIPSVGFPWAVRCAGFISLVILSVANILIRPYLPPRKSGPLVELAAFKEVQYSFFALGAFLQHYAQFFGFFYLNSFARKIGFGQTESVNVLLILNGMGIPVRPLWGYMADRWFGPINVYMASLAFLGAMMYIWTAVETRAGMYVFSVFYGMATGGAQGTYIGALASLTSDPTKIGTRSGMVSSLCAFASLAGPPTAGAIIGRSGGDYTGAQVWGGTVAMGAAVAAVCSRIALTGLKFKVKA